jgi:hypothetical protein
MFAVMIRPYDASIMLTNFSRSQDSVVSTLHTSYRLDNLGFQSQQERVSFLLLNVQTGFAAYKAS